MRLSLLVCPLRERPHLLNKLLQDLNLLRRLDKRGWLESAIADYKNTRHFRMFHDDPLPSVLDSTFRRWSNLAVEFRDREPWC